MTYSNGTWGTSSSESDAATIRIFAKTEVEVGGDITFLLGDVNEDGKVDASDALMIMRYTLNIITLTDKQMLAADMNSSGTVDASDALIIMRMTLGII